MLSRWWTKPLALTPQSFRYMVRIAPPSAKALIYDRRSDDVSLDEVERVVI